MKHLFFIIFLLDVVKGFSQEEIPGLITDRPDQTESAAVVPLHFLQIESGFFVEKTSGNQFVQKSFAYNSTLLRYGLVKNLELRLGLELLGDKNTVSGTQTNYSGLSPLYTGAKLKISEEKELKPDIAILGGLFLPFTANSNFKTENIQSILRLAFAHTLSDYLSLGYNFGSVWNGSSAIPDWIYSVSLGISLSERLGMFLESFGTFYRHIKAEHLLDTGFTFLVLPNLQFDVSGGMGIYNGVDHFFSCGLSWRIPN